MKKLIFIGTICLVLISAIVLGIRTEAPAGGRTALEERLYKAAVKEGELEWWDQHDLEEAGAVIKAFTKKYPGIKVTYYEGTQDVITERFLAEYKAGRATTDIIQVEPFKPLQELGLPSDISDIIKDTKYPLQFCTKDLTGATLEHTIFSVGYNTKLVSAADAPQSWQDLLDPKWKGKINIERRMKIFIYGTENWGEEWAVNYLQKLRRQNPTFTKGSGHTLTLLSVGEFPICVSVNLHRLLLMQAQGQPVGYVPTKPAIHKASSPHCIPKVAPHPNAAKLFMRFWMTPEGQALTEKIRGKGNPLPGSRTAQAGCLKKYGVPLFSATDWALDNYSRLRKLYAQAAGYSKERELKKKKKKK